MFTANLKERLGRFSTKEEGQLLNWRLATTPPEEHPAARRDLHILVAHMLHRLPHSQFDPTLNNICHAAVDRVQEWSGQQGMTFLGKCYECCGFSGREATLNKRYKILR